MTIALANVLMAKVMANPASGEKYQNVQTIPALFLGSETDADAQMEAIRSGMTEDVLERIANAMGIPVEFTAWLIGVDI